MSATTAARWARWGKRPGSVDEHGILEHSEPGGTAPAGIEAAIRALPLGGSWSVGGGPGARPWLHFVPVDSGAGAPDDDRARFAVAIVEDIGATDGYGRGTAAVRYTDIPLKTWLATDRPFTAMREALDAPTAAPSPGERASLSLQATPEPLSRTEKRQPKLFEWFLQVAGAVVDGPVAIVSVPDAASLKVRLAMLDTVAALLPAWARAYLSAGTWSTSSQHALRLVFGEGAGPQPTQIPLNIKIDRGESTGRDYSDLLAALMLRRGTDAVAADLAALTTPPDWALVDEAGVLVGALEELRGLEAAVDAADDLDRTTAAVERYPCRAGRPTSATPSTPGCPTLPNARRWPGCGGASSSSTARTPPMTSAAATRSRSSRWCAPATRCPPTSCGRSPTGSAARPASASPARCSRPPTCRGSSVACSPGYTRSPTPGTWAGYGPCWRSTSRCCAPSCWRNSASTPGRGRAGSDAFTPSWPRAS
ncbi:hypothetical protein [Dactylosporangium darangshiense]|uniref:hypothetical protein n=1 Tax=Dactylosporangium darangshiense TaxID=579108 RepID=UPI0036370ECC